MHRSRLCAIMIDCPPETMAASTRFWSAALGAIPIHSGDATDPYVALDGALGELRLELQQVDDQPRIHLDIETDDVEAEVRRLEQAGAQRHAQIESWWVLRDPSGHLFCVVPPQSADFEQTARVWD